MVVIDEEVEHGTVEGVAGNSSLSMRAKIGILKLNVIDLVSEERERERVDV